MTVQEELQFPVAIRWRGGRLAFAEAHDDLIGVATPPQFPGGLAGSWTPEDLLVAATASCFVLTLAAVAERRGAPLLDATVTATGHMGRLDDGRFGFRSIALDAQLEALPGSEHELQAAARVAETRCLVTHALAVPIRVDVAVRAPAAETAP
jgi:organic hydroperoxide reductase OsmC/OhrA